MTAGGSQFGRRWGPERRCQPCRSSLEPKESVQNGSYLAPLVLTQLQAFFDWPLTVGRIVCCVVYWMYCLLYAGRMVSQQCHFAGMQVSTSMISCTVQCILIGTHVENTTAQCQLSINEQYWQQMLQGETQSVSRHDQMN